MGFATSISPNQLTLSYHDRHSFILLFLSHQQKWRNFFTVAQNRCGRARAFVWRRRYRLDQIESRLLMRFLFYSHDGLGLGHTRRNVAIASALTALEPRASVLLAVGADCVSRLGLPPRVDILKLPGLRKITNGHYSARYLSIPFDEIRGLRAAMLLAAVKSFAPAVALVDKHPFGAGGEFRAGLRALKELGGKAVLGLRDILDEPAHVLEEWRPYHMQQRIADFYDAILVYGHRAVFDPLAAYEFPESVESRTHFCGYVANLENPEDVDEVNGTIPPREHRTRPLVLATAGGGEDGYVLLENFIRAAATAPWQGLVVAGPMAPEGQSHALKRLAAEHRVAFLTFVQHLSGLFGSVDALVCMGGYNTLVEATALGVPTVCVPRVTPRTEQLIRAEAFARLGLLRVCRPDQLDPQTLGDHIAVALKSLPKTLTTRAHRALNYDGARQAAKRLLRLATESVAVARRKAANPQHLAAH